ncbi:uncharacterized protein DSM5745_11130 [Aspergillus mulundensis]|uniref:Protein kinase domain-containing protein n=1 Tax=Aspergillus mulundensis TaxID=1810919 RepID=A0A3D8QBT8_9EURO|nr:hypothetical protein DSM5745_11130 [Aspergillus mulundensis]RDW58924.1 hypothetical protein DSM5745_11130 [Aspergillus mulundensis]
MENRTPSPWQSILAGGAAGGLESLLTDLFVWKYPTEYLKTRQQLQPTSSSKPLSPWRLLLSTLRQHGLSHMYTGSTAFCISNAAKSGVRFLAFDSARQLMPTDSSGAPTALGTMFAGMIAGAAESVFVVTPGETLKTKIIDDQAGARRYRSATHAIRSVVVAEGVAGLYRGVVPVTLKQSANAMVRFTSYSFFLGALRDVLGSGASVLAGALAGVVTVYATMPFDTLKTRMQAVDGRARYRGTLDCLRAVVANEGVAVLWRGTTPRLARLSISGAVSFSIYESVVQWTWSLRSGGLAGLRDTYTIRLHPQRDLHRIGIGASAQVYEVDGQIVLKTSWVFEQPGSDASDNGRWHYASDTLFQSNLLQNEQTVLRLLQQRPHPHIIEAIDAEQPEGIYLRRYRPMSLDQGPSPDQLHRICWYRGLTDALCHIHSPGIAHADVRIENVLFDEYGRAILCDFSASCPLGQPNPPSCFPGPSTSG